MKKAILAACAVAALGCSSSAFAADKPAAAPPPRPAAVVVPPPPNFTGIYFGAHAGGVVGAASSITLFPTSTQSDGSTIKIDSNGPGAAPGVVTQNSLFGGFIGANYQIGGWVLGAEGDWSKLYVGQSVAVATSAVGTGAGGTTPFVRTTTGCSVNFTASNAVNTADLVTDGFECNDKPQWVATARGKIGYALGAMMIYGTGGFAWGSVNRIDKRYTVHGSQNGTTVPTTITPTGASISETANLWGWTAGFGLDYLAAQNLIIGADLVFVDLNHGGDFAGDGTFAAEKVNTAFTMIRAKAALKFP